MSGVPPFPPAMAWKDLLGGGGYHSSHAQTASGRVVNVVNIGGQFRQWHYPTFVDFTFANNASATAPVDIRPMLPAGQVLVPVVYWHPSEGLHLITQGARNNGDNTGTTWIEVYRSPSGEGESAPGVPDWEYLSTVQNWTAGINDWGYGPEPWSATVPIITREGRVVIARLSPQGADWGSNNHPQAWYSSGSMAGPWTRPWKGPGHYIVGGRYVYDSARTVVIGPDGRLWWGTTGNVDGYKIHYTPAGGTPGVNWTSTEIGGNSSWYEHIAAGENDIYRTAQGTLQRTLSNDGVNGPWVSLHGTNAGRSEIQTILMFGMYVATRNNRVLQTQGGWKINML